MTHTISVSSEGNGNWYWSCRCGDGHGGYSSEPAAWNGGLGHKNQQESSGDYSTYPDDPHAGF